MEGNPEADEALCNAVFGVPGTRSEHACQLRHAVAIYLLSRLDARDTLGRVADHLAIVAASLWQASGLAATHNDLLLLRTLLLQESSGAFACDPDDYIRCDRVRLARAADGGGGGRAQASSVSGDFGLSRAAPSPSPPPRLVPLPDASCPPQDVVEHDGDGNDANDDRGSAVSGYTHTLTVVTSGLMSGSDNDRALLANLHAATEAAWRGHGALARLRRAAALALALLNQPDGPETQYVCSMAWEDMRGLLCTQHPAAVEEVRLRGAATAAAEAGRAGWRAVPSAAGVGAGSWDALRWLLPDGGSDDDDDDGSSSSAASSPLLRIVEMGGQAKLLLFMEHLMLLGNPPEAPAEGREQAQQEQEGPEERRGPEVQLQAAEQAVELAAWREEEEGLVAVESAGHQAWEQEQDVAEVAMGCGPAATGGAAAGGFAGWEDRKHGYGATRASHSSGCAGRVELDTDASAVGWSADAGRSANPEQGGTAEVGVGADPGDVGSIGPSGMFLSTGARTDAQDGSAVGATTTTNNGTVTGTGPSFGTGADAGESPTPCGGVELGGHPLVPPSSSDPRSEPLPAAHAPCFGTDGSASTIENCSTGYAATTDAATDDTTGGVGVDGAAAATALDRGSGGEPRYEAVCAAIAAAWPGEAPLQKVKRCAARILAQAGWSAADASGQRRYTMSCGTIGNELAKQEKEAFYALQGPGRMRLLDEAVAKACRAATGGYLKFEWERSGDEGYLTLRMGALMRDYRKRQEQQVHAQPRTQQQTQQQEPTGGTATCAESTPAAAATLGAAASSLQPPQPATPAPSDPTTAAEATSPFDAHLLWLFPLQPPSASGSVGGRLDAAFCYLARALVRVLAFRTPPPHVVKLSELEPLLLQVEGLEELSSPWDGLYAVCALGAGVFQLGWQATAPGLSEQYIRLISTDLLQLAPEQRALEQEKWQRQLNAATKQVAAAQAEVREQEKAAALEQEQEAALEQQQEAALEQEQAVQGRAQAAADARRVVAEMEQQRVVAPPSAVPPRQPPPPPQHQRVQPAVASSTHFREAVSPAAALTQELFRVFPLSGRQRGSSSSRAAAGLSADEALMLRETAQLLAEAPRPHSLLLQPLSRALKERLGYTRLSVPMRIAYELAPDVMKLEGVEPSMSVRLVCPRLVRLAAAASSGLAAAATARGANSAKHTNQQAAIATSANNIATREEELRRMKPYVEADPLPAAPSPAAPEARRAVKGKSLDPTLLHKLLSAICTVLLESPPPHAMTIVDLGSRVVQHLGEDRLELSIKEAVEAAPSLLQIEGNKTKRVVRLVEQILIDRAASQAADGTARPAAAAAATPTARAPAAAAPLRAAAAGPSSTAATPAAAARLRQAPAAVTAVPAPVAATAAAQANIATKRKAEEVSDFGALQQHPQVQRRASTAPSSGTSIVTAASNAATAPPPPPPPAAVPHILGPTGGMSQAPSNASIAASSSGRVSTSAPVAPAIVSDFDIRHAVNPAAALTQELVRLFPLAGRQRGGSSWGTAAAMSADEALMLRATAQLLAAAPQPHSLLLQRLGHAIRGRLGLQKLPVPMRSAFELAPHVFKLEGVSTSLSVRLVCPRLLVLAAAASSGVAAAAITRDTATAGLRQAPAAVPAVPAPVAAAVQPAIAAKRKAEEEASGFGALQQHPQVQRLASTASSSGTSTATAAGNAATATLSPPPPPPAAAPRSLASVGGAPRAAPTAASSSVRASSPAPVASALASVLAGAPGRVAKPPPPPPLVQQQLPQQQQFRAAVPIPIPVPVPMHVALGQRTTAYPPTSTSSAAVSLAAAPRPPLLPPPPQQLQQGPSAAPQVVAISLVDDEYNNEVDAATAGYEPLRGKLPEMVAARSTSRAVELHKGADAKVAATPSPTTAAAAASKVAAPAAASGAASTGAAAAVAGEAGVLPTVATVAVSDPYSPEFTKLLHHCRACRRLGLAVHSASGRLCIVAIYAPATHPGGGDDGGGKDWDVGGGKGSSRVGDGAGSGSKSGRVEVGAGGASGRFAAAAIAGLGGGARATGYGLRGGGGRANESWPGAVYLVDCTACAAEYGDGGRGGAAVAAMLKDLRGVLEKPDVTKVVHGCEQVRCLELACGDGTAVSPLLDTSAPTAALVAMLQPLPPVPLHATSNTSSTNGRTRVGPLGSASNCASAAAAASTGARGSAGNGTAAGLMAHTDAFRAALGEVGLWEDRPELLQALVGHHFAAHLAARWRSSGEDVWWLPRPLLESQAAAAAAAAWHLPELYDALVGEAVPWVVQRTADRSMRLLREQQPG